MTAMFRPTRSLSYAPALNTANERWSGSNTHTAVRDVHLIWLPMDARWDAFRTESAFVGLIERCGFTTSTPS